MPDQLNKQSLVNLLIDSPLREPIKINLIDIVNNTPDPDLPKVFPTITKELEIFQKATERRMKLAEETIAKLGGTPLHIESPEATREMTPGAQQPGSPLPAEVQQSEGLTVPPLDLPPLPQMPASPSASLGGPSTPAPVPPSPTDLPSPPAELPTPAPLGGPAASPQGDEAALAEIQKELESLKSDVTADAAPAPAPMPPSPQTV